MPGLPIIVLGPQRTGTSAIAEMLHVQCGVCMGHDLRKPNKSNPGGYYEDLPIQRLNLGLSRGRISRGRYLVKMQEEAAERALCGVWGFKDPTACMVLPTLQQAFPDATIVRTSRPLEETVDSWERVYSVSAPEATAAIRTAERMLDRYAPQAIEVSTEDMSTDRLAVYWRMRNLVSQIRGDICQRQHQPTSSVDSKE